MSQDHGFHVFDVVSGCRNGGRELVFRGVVYVCKDVVYQSAPYGRVVFSRASFVEDEAFCKVGDQYRDYS